MKEIIIVNYIHTFSTLKLTRRDIIYLFYIIIIYWNFLKNWWNEKYASWSCSAKYQLTWPSLPNKTNCCVKNYWCHKRVLRLHPTCCGQQEGGILSEKSSGNLGDSTDICNRYIWMIKLRGIRKTGCSVLLWSSDARPELRVAVCKIAGQHGITRTLWYVTAQRMPGS